MQSTLAQTSEETMLREAVRGIVSDFGPSYFIEKWQKKELMDEVWNALGEKGFVGVNIPEEYGGGGLGMLELAAVGEEAAAAGVPLLMMVVSPAIVGNIIAKFGTKEQKARWLPGIGDGTMKIAFAITEPDAGSNSHNLATTATRTDNGWVLKGTKTYISGVEECAAILVVAKTGMNEQTGKGLLSLFVIDSEGPGIERQHIPTAIMAPENQWTLFFDDMELPEDRLIGTVNEGLKAVFQGLNPERIMSAVTCNGIGRYALDKAAAYARERKVWKTPIGAHQGISHPLAEAKIELELARLMTRHACMLYDAGSPEAPEASNMAKYAAAEAGLRCLEQAIQTHGGNGMALEYQLANYWGMVRLLRIAPVSREMVLNYVAEHTLGLPKSY